MHIMVGTDGSSHAIAAATRALRLLAPADTLTLVAAAQTPAVVTQGLESGFAGGIASQAQIDAAWNQVQAELRAALAATRAALEGAPHSPSIREKMETGEAGAVLCQLASELEADVIVVGSRGRGALKRVLLGSVSSYVVHHAPCAALVVPQDLEASPP